MSALDPSAKRPLGTLTHTCNIINPYRASKKQNVQKKADDTKVDNEILVDNHQGENQGLDIKIRSIVIFDW